MHVEGLEKTLTSIHQLNPEEFAGCANAYPSLDTIESFNSEDVAAISSDDAAGPIYNYEWVDEIMQTLNVSPDISNAFHVRNILITFFILCAQKNSCLFTLTGNCRKHK